MTKSHELASMWNKGAEAWETLFEPQRVPLYDAILDACGVRAGDTLLDAGSGSGGISLAATRRGANVSGFDISEGMVALAQSKVPGAEFRVGGIDAIPFGDGSFDQVIACDCLYFAEDKVAAVGELGRVCRNTGRIAIMVWELPDKSDYSLLFEAMHEVIPSRPKIVPLSLSGDGALEDLATGAGLQIEEILSVPLEYRFRSFSQYWEAGKNLAVIQGMIRSQGEDKIRNAALSVAEPRTGSNGEVLFRNAYRVLIAQP